MKKRKEWIILAAHIFALALVGTLSIAAPAQEVDPKGFNSRGYIGNAVNTKCWYTQTYQKTNPHFMPSSMAKTTHQEVRTIRFDDSNCMGTTIVDKMMINNVVSQWFLGTYVRKDAAFDTRNLRRPGKYEARGQCIQSKKYPSKAIAIEYVSEDDSITSVVYMLALGGCG